MIENKYKSIPFWSWNNQLDKKELIKQIVDMKAVGMGGFFIHARTGLKTNYLSDEWFDCVSACIDEAKKQDMEVWLYDENGWPSGFCGGKLLQDVDNLERYITFSKSDKFDETTPFNYIVKDEKLELVKNDIGSNEYLHIYEKISPSNTDILNRKVVDKFIASTHEEYYKKFGDEFGKAIKGFFIDEPQYYRADTPFSPVLIDYFKEKYQIEIYEKLPLLFIELPESYAFRFKYWKTLQQLFIQNFIKPIYDWCNNHNCMLTGHGCEESVLHTQMWCSAGVMQLYEYFHIPGIDWLGREIGSEMAPKQLGSVVSQLNIKSAITETFGCSGWDTTPKELKHISEWQYVNGVNKMCEHLYDYSIEGMGKRDYPLHFSEHNTWFSEMKTFNDYFDNLGKILSESKEIVEVGIIHPISSCYLTYKRNDDYESLKDLEESFTKTIEKFGTANIPHHYIDETILSRYGSVELNNLVVGQNKYKIIVLPKLLNLESSTVEFLKEFIKNGGKIFVNDVNLPCFKDGEKYDLSFLKSNISFEEILGRNLVKINSDSLDIRSTIRQSDKGAFIYLVNLSLEKASKIQIEYKNKIYDNYLKDGESKIIYLDKLENSSNLNKKEIKLNEIFKIENISENTLTLDKASYSYDGKTFSEKQYCLAIYDELLREDYKGDMFLKYEFDLKYLPEKLSLICEDMSILSCQINGNELSLLRQNKMDKLFLSQDIERFLKYGNNDIIFKIHYYQRPEIQEILYGENITESLKNCIYYDSIIESVYLKGDFGVYGDLNKVDEEIYLGDNFYIDKRQETLNISKILDDGFPFFAGKMTLSQIIDVEDLNSKIVLNGRYAVAKISLNGKFIKNCMFDKEVDISNYLKLGKNLLEIELINSNRNLFGPHHYQLENEPKALGAFQFNMASTFKSGKSEFYRDNYSFVWFGLKV